MKTTPKPLFERGNTRIEKTTLPDKEIVEHLASTVWGTPGGTLFQHMDTRELIHDLVNPQYISCQRHDKLIALISFFQRDAFFQDKMANAFYIHHLAFQQKFRVGRPGKGKKRTAPSDRVFISPKSWIKQQMLEIFDRPELLSSEGPEPGKAVFYAFIEAENERSLQIAGSFGFQKIRRFKTLAFSRFNPKKDPKASRIQEVEKPPMLEKLRQFYQDHTLFFTDHIFLNNNYYVLREGEEIVAGVQATPVHWVIRGLPGFSGKLILKLLPRTPYLSRLFNPKDFRPVVFEAFYYKPGYEGHLIRLFETVLAECKTCSALMWLDNQSRPYDMLSRCGRLGVLNKLQQNTPADVIARFVNYPEEEIRPFREQPVYISAFDLT